MHLTVVGEGGSAHCAPALRTADKPRPALDARIGHRPPGVRRSEPGAGRVTSHMEWRSGATWVLPWLAVSHHQLPRRGGGGETHGDGRRRDRLGAAPGDLVFGLIIFLPLFASGSARARAGGRARDHSRAGRRARSTYWTARVRDRWRRGPDGRLVDPAARLAPRTASTAAGHARAARRGPGLHTPGPGRRQCGRVAQAAAARADHGGAESRQHRSVAAQRGGTRQGGDGDPGEERNATVRCSGTAAPVGPPPRG